MTPNLFDPARERTPLVPALKRPQPLMIRFAATGFALLCLAGLLAAQTPRERLYNGIELSDP